MYLHWIDWAMVATLILFLGLVAFYCRRFTTEVTGFLSANRCAGRYLLTIGDGMAGVGLITIIARFEQFYTAGLGVAWWGIMTMPVMTIVTLSGFIIYRYRQTRCLTMAEFFELRYSKKFRIFAGMTAWISGVINYGIFPAVTGRFIVYFCGLPQYTIEIAGINLNLTLGFVILVMLSIAITFTLWGGQIAVMVTDFIQGTVYNIGFVIIGLYIVKLIDWQDLVSALDVAAGEGSYLNPMNQAQVSSFKLSFFLIYTFTAVYGYMAWQSNQGYNSSARTPHEARMGRVISIWREILNCTIIMILPLCAIAVLKGGLFPELATDVNSIIQGISEPSIQGQVTTSVFVTKFLPVGLVGLFCMIMISAAISTDDTSLHSWGAIFIQDVYVPLTGKGVSEKKHLQLLRYSIIGVAVFAWFFSMLFPLRDYIYMFFAITGAIFIGGAGSVIIGGLYWKRGTTAGAWAAMITGMTVAVLGVFVKNIFWPCILPGLKERYIANEFIHKLPDLCPMDMMQMAFVANLLSIIVYVVVSLSTKVKSDFDIDKMLHRGKYEIENEHNIVSKDVPFYQRIFGITKEFTIGDKIVYLLSILWSFLILIVFITGTIWGVFFKTTEEGWAIHWYWRLIVFGVVGLIATIWFAIGGIKDLFIMFGLLKKSIRQVSINEESEDV